MATYKDYLNMSLDELNALNTKEMRKATRVLADVANKRLVNIEKKGLKDYSPAYNYIMSEYEDDKRKSLRTGKFSTKGMNRNALYSEFTRAKDFINAKTSTVKGAVQYEKEFHERFGNPSKAKMKKFSKLEHEFRKNNQGLMSSKAESNAVVQYINRVVQNNMKDENGNKLTKEQLFENALEEAEQAYLTQQQEEQTEFAEMMKNFDF